MIRVCVWWENQNCNESMYGFVLFCTWTCAESLRKKARCRGGCKQSVEGWCQTEWYRIHLKRSSTITCFWPKALGWLMGQSQRERERERARKIGLERALFKGGNGEVWGFCVFFVAEKEDEREREEELKFGVISGCLYRWQIWCWGPCVVMSFIGGWCIANLSLDMKYELCCYVCWFTWGSLFLCSISIV